MTINPDMVNDTFSRYRVTVEKTNPNGESLIEDLIIQVPKDDKVIYTLPLHKKMDCGYHQLEIKGIERVK